jgi:hypothetical protein
MQFTLHMILVIEHDFRALAVWRKSDQKREVSSPVSSARGSLFAGPCKLYVELQSTSQIQWSGFSSSLQSFAAQLDQAA